MLSRKIGMADFVWHIPAAAVGKPRMTQRDKWKRRPAVVRYRAFADLVRSVVGGDVPDAAATTLVSVEAYYRATKDQTGRKRTKPDPDNIAKSILDILWKEDQAVGDIFAARHWGDEDATIVSVWCVEDKTNGERNKP